MFLTIVMTTRIFTGTPEELDTSHTSEERKLYELYVYLCNTEIDTRFEIEQLLEKLNQLRCPTNEEQRLESLLCLHRQYVYCYSPEEILLMHDCLRQLRSMRDHELRSLEMRLHDLNFHLWQLEGDIDKTYAKIIAIQK